MVEVHTQELAYLVPVLDTVLPLALMLATLPLGMESLRELQDHTALVLLTPWILVVNITFLCRLKNFC